MNDEDLRDLFAFGVMLGQIMKRGYVEVAKTYEIADEMIEAKYAEKEPDVGITAIKRKYIKKEKSNES
jgi:hypothetical protein